MTNVQLFLSVCFEKKMFYDAIPVRKYLKIKNLLFLVRTIFECKLDFFFQETKLKKNVCLIYLQNYKNRRSKNTIEKHPKVTYLNEFLIKCSMNS